MGVWGEEELLVAFVLCACLTGVQVDIGAKGDYEYIHISIS